MGWRPLSGIQVCLGVLAPGTYFRMAGASGILCYTYDSPVTKNKIHPKQLDDFFDKADYVFEECEAVENIEQIAEWSGAFCEIPLRIFAVDVPEV